VDKLELLLAEDDVKAKIKEVAAKINDDYAGKELLVIGILRGAFIFMADLVRELKMPVKVDFMAVSSYGKATMSSGVVRILKDLDESVAGCHLLLVEDIIDSGLTLKYLVDYLQARQPASLRVCTLLDKPDRRQVDLKPDYNGFTIPDYFAVGFGLDYSQHYRNLPGVYILKPDQSPADPDPSEGMK
jgi:hypoxanthine phosphoribosyltransferase